MTIDANVLAGVMMATWSLEEAAYYVHNLDPETANGPISDRSTSKTAKTYYWLLKEFDRQRLRPVKKKRDSEDRFIPGTIMRHLEERGLGFHKPVLTAYLKHGILTGPSDTNTQTKFMFRKAAAIIRSMHPSIRKAQVAKLLVELPGRLNEKWLPSYGEVAIRRYLKDMWPGKSGRPPKDEADLPKLDWTAIIKKLI